MEYQKVFASPIQSSVKMAGGKSLKDSASQRMDKEECRLPLMNFLMRGIWLAILWVIEIAERDDDIIYLIYYFRILNLNFIYF